MNKTEQVFYEEYILPRVESGEIARWRFEEITFRLAEGPDKKGGESGEKDKKQKTTYTPDFYVVNSDGSVHIFETKGSFYHEDARVKYKIAADKFKEFDWNWVEIKGKKITSIHKWNS